MNVHDVHDVHGSLLSTSQELPAISGLYREEHSQPQNPVPTEAVTVTWETWEGTWGAQVDLVIFGFLIWICPRLPNTSWNYMKLFIKSYRFTSQKRWTLGFQRVIASMPWGAMQRRALHVGKLILYWYCIDIVLILYWFILLIPSSI